MESPEAMQRIATMAEAVGASSCFGAPTTVGDRAMVPVADVIFGFGFGWGGQKAAEPAGERGGGGAGGGARSRGVAVIEVAPDGVHVHAIRDESAMMLARTAVVLAALAMLCRVLLGLARGR